MNFGWLRRILYRETDYLVVATIQGAPWTRLTS
jgi:hypothetical protein